jgi:chemotaxis protein CheC
MEVEAAHVMIEGVLGIPSEDRTVVDFDEMQRSVIEEIGNIMISSYLTSLAGLTNSMIKPSIPFLSIDMAQAILSVPIIEFGKMADKVLFIESKISVDNVASSGCFILVPNLHSFYRIIRALGVE